LEERLMPDSKMTSALARVRAGIYSAGARVGDALVRYTIRHSLSEAQRTLGVTLIAGGASGLLAVAFHSSIQAAERFLIERAQHAPAPWWLLLTLACPMSGGLLAGLILAHAFPAAAGSGIPQVKAAYAVRASRLRLRDGAAKFATTVLQLGSGASLGREGPTVHICSAFSSALGRWFALSPKNARRLLPVGAAAGVAAAFNAPIAAVTFTVEEIVGNLDQTLLSGVVVAAALAAVIEHECLGSNPVFNLQRTLAFQHMASLPLYAGLGCLAGLVSAGFSSLLLRLRAVFQRQIGLPPAIRPALGGLLTGLCAALGLMLVHSSGVAGGGYAELSQALEGSLPIATLLTLGVLKFAATLFSYSSGGAGGLFAPALFIGAMLGGSVGWLDQRLLGYSEVGEFALVGMGAVFSGVIRAPITAVLIVFEMTDGYALVLPLMIANAIAYLVARQFDSRGLYDALLEQDGIELPQRAAAGSRLDRLRVEQAMTTDVRTLAGRLSVGEALGAVHREPFSVYPVTAEDGRCLGLVDVASLRRVAAQGGVLRALSSVAQPGPSVSPEDALTRAVVRMNSLGSRQLLVLDRTDSSLRGLIAMSDIVRAQALAVESSAVPSPHGGRAPLPSEPFLG
jgi:CIC family chloride channel protein